MLSSYIDDFMIQWFNDLFCLVSIHSVHMCILCRHKFKQQKKESHTNTIKSDEVIYFLHLIIHFTKASYEGSLYKMSTYVWMWNVLNIVKKTQNCDLNIKNLITNNYLFSIIYSPKKVPLELIIVLFAVNHNHQRQVNASVAYKQTISIHL